MLFFLNRLRSISVQYLTVGVLQWCAAQQQFFHTPPESLFATGSGERDAQSNHHVERFFGCRLVWVGQHPVHEILQRFVDFVLLVFGIHLAHVLDNVPVCTSVCQVDTCQCVCVCVCVCRVDRTGEVSGLGFSKQRRRKDRDKKNSREEHFAKHLVAAAKQLEKDLKALDRRYKVLAS